MASTLRFLQQYLRPRHGVVEASDVVYHRDGEPLPATLYRPAGRPAPLPAWVVLHGLTFQGRKHPSLDRFVRALAASGSAVFVPEVPEWSRLRVAPAATAPSAAAAIDALGTLGIAVPDRVGILGFSFGATQALVAAADPRLAGRFRSIVAWGGYADLRNLFRFGFTGEHELDGIEYRLEPDPYGGWIMGANYLTRIPGQEDAGDVAAALLRLAEESGRRGVHACDPVYDPLKAVLREAILPARRELFDAFAPLAGRRVIDPAFARYITGALADAALEADPMLDPGPSLPGVRARTLVAHGRDDRLVPFTESLRLGRTLPRDACGGCTITSLFAHSGGAAHTLGAARLTREAARFGRLLRRILNLV